MKRFKLYFTVFFVFINFMALPQVYISGGYVSGFWDEFHSPYFITGDIEVHADSALIIGPGTDIIFYGYYQFVVRGRLTALGTEEDSIHFTTPDKIPSWHGLKFYDITNNDQDTCVVKYCKFEKGYSPGGSVLTGGGAIFINNSTKIVVDHCLLTHNKASWGGGILVYSGDAQIRNCVIADNEANQVGGGISIESGTAAVTGCEIRNNQAWIAGGISIHGSSATIENSVIKGNSSHIMGGGITSYFGTGPTCKNVIIENNTSGVGGGVMTNSSGLWLEGVTIRQNWGDFVGGLYIGSSISFSQTNRCNIYMNHSYRAQDILKPSSARNVTIYLDTFTVKQPDDFLVTPLNAFDFHILHGFVTGQTGSDLYVSPSGSNDNSGLTIQEPLLTLDYAVRKVTVNASNPPTLFLDDGIYSNSLTGEYFPIGLKSYINLVSLNPHQAVIDAENEKGGLVIFGRSGTHVKGLKIMNGYTPGGGGIYVSGSNILIDSCVLFGNHATEGGGIYLANESNVKLTYCDFISNTGSMGAGCFVFDGSSVIENCKFINNVSSQYGGAIHISGDHSHIVSSLFLENRSRGGGAIETEWYNSFIINNTFHDNDAINGSSIYCIYSNCELINSIVWDDSVQTPLKIYLASDYSGETFEVTIDHCDLMNDSCCVYTGQNINLLWGEGNISYDPDFIDPVAQDFRLQDISPCIDAGTPLTSIYNLPEWDLAGNQRIVNDTIDLGCYENQLGVTIHDIIYTPACQIFPNPDNGHFYIKLPQKDVSITVYDVTGKTIIANVKPDSTLYECNLSSLKPGIYIVTVESFDNQWVRKIIVE